MAESLAIHFHPDNSLIACLIDSQILVWDTETHNQVATLRVDTGHLNDIVRRSDRDFNDFVFSRDGCSLLAVHKDQTVQWSLGKLKSIDVAPDGLRCAAGSETGKIIVWDAG